MAHSSTRRSVCRTRRRTTPSATASTRTTCRSPARSPTSQHRTRATRCPSAPSSNTCWLLARDHAAPESTLALAKAASLGRERVRPLAWCSRTRNSAALLDEALAETGLEEEDDQRPAHVEGHQHREDHPGSDHRATRMPDVLANVAVADERACLCWAALLIGLLRGHQKTFSITSVG